MQETDSPENLNKLGKALMNSAVMLFVICIIFMPALIGIPIMLFLGGLGLQMSQRSDEFNSGVPGTSSSNYVMAGATPRIEPNTTFNGVWDSDWGEIKLIQNGIDVIGTFIGAELNGQVTGRKFFFDWIKEDENLSGRGVLTIENGLLIGSWGHGDSRDDGGPIKANPQTDAPKLLVNEPGKASSFEEKISSEIPASKIETIAKEEPKEFDKIEQIKQAAQDKKEEMSEQIKERVEEFEGKVPEEIKVTESFQELKSSVEEKIENLDEKANRAIEEVMVESTEQMEQVQEKVLLSLEDSLSKLNETLERLDKAVMTKDRERIVSELSGSQMNLNMTIDRIDNTIGYGIDDALRGGKTIVGNIEGVPHPVSIRVPKSMNDFASGLKKGRKIEQNATLSSFNSIRKMLEFVINK